MKGTLEYGTSSATVHNLIREYPVDVSQNMRYRMNLVTESLGDAGLREVIREKCRRDILYYFNTMLWAEDPFAERGRRRGILKSRMRPIVTYPSQDEVILMIKRCMEDGEDVIGDKSRDMLATYIVCGCALWGWLFKGWKGIASSWLEEEIDGKEDTSTLFGKIRFMLRKHPIWMLPKGFEVRLGTEWCSYMKLINPENGGTIVGKAASANIGSGRREDWVFFDEFSKWQAHANSAWDGVTDTTPCKIGVWTPRGSGNKAAELMRGEEVSNKFHLLWYKHPEKCYTGYEHYAKIGRGQIRDKIGNYVVSIGDGESPEGCYVDQFGKIRSEWYDDECRRRDPDDIRENLDCNYITSGNQEFDSLRCEMYRSRSVMPKKVGNLRWKTRPMTDDYGNCVNMKNLEVEFYESFNGVVRVWEEPLPDWDENAYIIAADVAEGLEQGDYDSAGVIKRINDIPEEVAAVHGKMPVYEYAELLVMLAVWYGKCVIAPECNGKMGGAITEQIFRIYNRIYHKEIFNKGYAERKDALGWYTNSNSKPTIIKNLGKLISGEYNENGEQVDAMIVKDERFWKECLTFVNENGKLEAQGKSRGEKCYDDVVMKTAIGMWVTNNLPLPKRTVRRKESYAEYAIRLSGSSQSGKQLIRCV